jgi:hypothetical protein
VATTLLVAVKVTLVVPMSVMFRAAAASVGVTAVVVNGALHTAL